MFKFVKSFANFVVKTAWDVTAGVIAAAVILWVWLNHPELILQAMDFNLGLIRDVSGLMNAKMGAQAETAFRAILAGDKMLMILQVMILVKVIGFACKWTCKGCFKGACWAFRRRKARNAEATTELSGELVPA